ncbi:hypothetical protein [Sporolactobacillus putidus]|uniref:Uncharacterized protein n=1 Tax=Sporolactobacillus putidus TaxID=492735 RepID=A0A917S8Z1_9BACL|nr:hypothetical protein [Sporolactobacillus putidus]GGL62217.1 hypothetical protein GCM10007968_27740 [Sporolactobacillus putidus]
MSFVSIVASDNMASVVSDGLLVDLSGNGEPAILPGKKPSMIRISSRQILACTGSAAVLKSLRKAFPYQENAWSINESRMHILEQLVREVPFEKQEVLLALVDAGGMMTCSMFSNEPGEKWHVLRPEGERLATMFLAGREINETKIKQVSEEFGRLIHLYGKDSTDHIFAAQRELIHFVSETDPLVGGQIFHQNITRK